MSTAQSYLPVSSVVHKWSFSDEATLHAELDLLPRYAPFTLTFYSMVDYDNAVTFSGQLAYHAQCRRWSHFHRYDIIVHAPINMIGICD